MNIFDYSDPGSFLRDSYIELKKINPGVSHRYIAEKLGLKSPAIFLLILKGRVNPSMEKCEILADIFKLHETEKQYLYLMFRARKIKDPELRKLVLEK